jgi:uncharacterized membrane protein YphA (DoxX/SURF4 family)
LQRLFSAFPAGLPGVGLLLLRIGVFVVLVVQGAACLNDQNAPTWGTWAVGAMAALTGALLLIGLMTPLAGTLAALGSAGIVLSWLPSPAPHTLGAGLAGFLPVVVAVAIALLGPGAISVDAALFGRREITIPHLRSPARED